MVPPFDIFQKEPDGKLRWIEAAESLESAQARVQKFMKLSPGEYMIFSQKTGNKILIGSPEPL